MTFREWVEKWQIGPGMNDGPGVKLYSGIDGMVGEGWIGIIDRLAADLVALGWNRDLHQVKEKFGGLRFYIGVGTDAMHDRIDQSELESIKTCEVCGAPGKLRESSTGWLNTRCQEH